MPISEEGRATTASADFQYSILRLRSEAGAAVASMPRQGSSMLARRRNTFLIPYLRGFMRFDRASLQSSGVATGRRPAGGRHRARRRSVRRRCAPYR